MVSPGRQCEERQNKSLDGNGVKESEYANLNKPLIDCTYSLRTEKTSAERITGIQKIFGIK